MNDYREIKKGNLSAELHQASGGALAAYRKKVLGGGAGLTHMLRYELAALFCQNLGGGAGYFLRKMMLASLFQSCGKSPIFGRGLVLRKPGHIVLGDNIAFDDDLMLDGCCEGDGAIRIGNRVVISKGCVVQAKTAPCEIGDDCDIGAYTLLSSIGGIILEPSVLIAGNCYIGGGRYHFEDRNIPVMDQGLVQADKRMGPARVPDAALGGIPLMGDPDVGLEII